MKYLILIAALCGAISVSTISIAGNSKSQLENTDTKNDKTEDE